MNKMLFDTDVLIEYLRGKDEAQTYVDNIQELVHMSSISMAELYAGVRKGEELRRLEVFFRTFEVTCLTKERARNKFGNWRRIYVRIQGVATGA